MFEKEAEEYRKDLKSKFFLSEPQLDLACQGFKDGYNKANEWHYVKDGKYPKETKKYFIYSKEWGVELRKFFADVGYFECRKNDVIAWKEIVLPELKENE